MKAGIVTFHNALNYGAVLQTYALQKSLQKLGCDAQVIDYRNENISKFSEPQRKDYRNPFKYKRDAAVYHINCVKREKIARFSDTCIPKTPFTEKKNLAEAAVDFDMVFTGSDQVWNDAITGKDDAFYLDFVPGEKRCSYAASIGTERISESDVPRVNRFLSEFRAISVREMTAVAALREQLGIQSVRVLDPTLLLTEKDYREIAESTEKQPYVLLYMLMYSKTLLDSAKKTAKKRGIPLYCINASGKLFDGTIDKSDAGIEEWLSLFLNADFVLTNSFHGTAFSINFEKDFSVELPPKKVKAGSRITDLLNLFGLQDRIISDGNINDEKISYMSVESALAAERETSLDFLHQAIDGNVIPQQKKNNSVVSVLWDHCSGCGLCEKICPVQAIQMKNDSHGFVHPQIDFDKCVRCGKCLDRCPYQKAERHRPEREPIQIFAAYSRNSQTVRDSSSGGIFKELAENTLSNGGVVYGAAFSDDFVCEHRRIEKAEDIEPLMGSKYVQSNAYLTFDSVKYDLQNGRKVLFVGTPCQIAALREYCKTEDANLLAVDFVCHGIPSPKMLKDHIQLIEKYFHSKLSLYKPRSKVQGWGHHELFVFQNGKSDWSHPITQAYKNIFHRDCCLRGSCYHCPFTNFDRPGDITIADYWGLDKTRPDLFRKDGVSLVMTNTPKGEAVLEKMNNLGLFPTAKDTIPETKQPHLFRPIKRPDFVERFWADYLHYGWKYTIEKYAECDRKSLIKRKIKKLLRALQSKNRKGNS